MASEVLTRARVAHAIPGRVRLRFERDIDVAEVARRLEAALAGVVGILAVEPRPAARSVVVLYDPTQVDPRRLVEESLPATVELLEPGALAPAGRAGGTIVGRNVVSGVAAVNAILGRATAGFLDLRDALPLSLIGFGLRRVVRGQLQPVPWYNLLYYGYSTFAALHGRRAMAEPDARELLRRRYARGELTREEFREMMAELEGEAR